MRFIKNNSSIISKLYVNQIGIAIFSMFLYTIIAALQNEEQGYSLLFKVLVSVFALIFYFSLIYLAVWEIAAGDKIKIDGGRMEIQKSKGFLIGFFANLINFIVWGASVVLMFIYLMGGGEGFKNVFAVLNAIFRIFCSMYLGVVQGIATLMETSGILDAVSSAFESAAENTYYLVETIGFLILPLISVGVTAFAYFMGVNNYRIFSHSNNKNNKSK